MGKKIWLVILSVSICVMFVSEPFAATGNYKNETVIDIPQSAYLDNDFKPYGMTTSTIQVNDIGDLTDIKVTLNAIYPWALPFISVSLKIALISPNGTEIVLFDKSSAYQETFTDAYFDDDAATLISESNAPYVGSYKPVQALSGLNGEQIAGEWKIQIIDGSPDFREGTVNSWQLDMTYAPPSGEQAPIVRDDYVVSVYNAPVVINVLQNDLDPEGAALTVSADDLPQQTNAKGTLQLNEDNTITYTPALGFFGEDRFTYIAYDGSLNSQSAIVTINVTAINDGGFEKNADNSPWQMSATCLKPDPIHIDAEAACFGTGYVKLEAGGNCAQTTELKQTITIPDSEKVYLRFWLNMTDRGLDSRLDVFLGNDTIYSVTNASTEFLAWKWTNPIDISQYKTQTRELKIKFTSGVGADKVATFHLDDMLIFYEKAGVEVGIDPAGTITNQRKVTINATGDNIDKIKYDLYQGDTLIKDDVIVETTTVGTVTAEIIELLDGSYTLHVWGYDSVNQAWQENATEATWTIDTNVTLNLANDTVPKKSKTWTWAAQTGIGPFEYRHLINQMSTTTPSGDYSANDTTDTFIGEPDKEGTYYLHVQVKDSEGTEHGPFHYSFIIDNKKPVVTGLSDATVPVYSKTWNWNATDIDTTIVFRFRIDQNETGTPTGLQYSDVKTASTSSGASGRWYIHVQAKDRAGNESLVKTVYVELKPPFGDINKSGAVNLIDAIVGLKILSGIPLSSNATIEIYADVNKNQKIDIAEVIYAMQYVAKLIN